MRNRGGTNYVGDQGLDVRPPPQCLRAERLRLLYGDGYGDRDGTPPPVFGILATARLTLGPGRLCRPQGHR
jgi:hypothetical protein